MAVILLTSQALRAAKPDVKRLEELARTYTIEIRPLVVRYCQECHAGDLIEAEVDLSSFPTLADVRKQPEIWQKVREILDSGQMPPKDARQPTDAERTSLQKWVRSYLTVEAQTRAGDPGRVILRRLNNVEYTRTLRDLTGVDSLQPAREFPVDGAAGEGFTNTGNALVMSPALVTKYLDAAKEVASHAVLLPDGFRFSPATTRSDWKNEVLASIRQMYREHTDAQGATRVNLQGIVFDTNDGGRLPLEKYLAATLVERDELTSGRKSTATVARERGLSAKYLETLWKALGSEKPSFLLDGLRQRWRGAKLEEAGALTAEIGRWQQALWKLSSVGHIGKLNGPKRWLEPISPLVAKQDIRFKIPATPDSAEVSIFLVASDAADGNEQDFVVWQQPRLVAPGRPDLLLRDVREVSGDLAARRARMFANTVKFLNAADEAAAAQGRADVAELAKKHDVEVEALRAWLDYLGVGASGPIKIEGYFTEKLPSAAGYDFVKGWGSHNTPLLLANSSDQHVRVPGNMKPHGVAVHPSPTLRAAVGWRSPLAGKFRIEALVKHAHPECGNGVTWSLELRRGATRQRLATGIAQGNGEAKAGPIENVAVQPGDLVSLLIGPRDGNHSCDLTAIDLKLTSAGDAGRSWNLADDVSSDILAGNPHADRFGNDSVWHFYTEPDKGGGEIGPVIPAGSLLTKWQAAQNANEKRMLANELQTLLTSDQSAAKDSPDAALFRQVTAFGGPLLRSRTRESSDGGLPTPATKENSDRSLTTSATKEWGLDPALFGKHPNGTTLDAASLCVRAPSVVEMRLPADLAAGCELVTTGVLDSETGAEGSVQLQMLTTKPVLGVGLLPSEVTVTIANGQWTANNWRSSYAAPILVNDGSASRQRIESGFDDFRSLFPAVLCYTRIVPVDEVVTLTLFYREDDHLARLMLDEAEQARLNRLWDELHYISHDALTLVDAFAQLMEFATQDADPKVFEPLRKPIHDRAAAFRKLLVETEPKHLDALLDFATRAYRRPLTDAETRELQTLYRQLRDQELSHDEAFRLALARVLVAPAFLYRFEKPGPGTAPTPVSDWELASRLSYFLWSSQPDQELRTLAAANRLHEPDVLKAQAQRLLKDEHVRALATEFACQWLGIRDFDSHGEKSEKVFPTFVGLRGDMYEESVRYFVDLFQRDGSVLEVLEADHTFLNEPLAKHYGIPGVTGQHWRRVDGTKQYGRGGILGMATTLAQQSGASRTSPVLRGNWVVEVLLGEKLPRPPKNVPQLPESETDTDLTVRQLVEKHRSNVACAHCHDRIDPFGFALEGFDAIGRRRDKDLAGRAIDTRVELKTGLQFAGESGLRNYLLETRRADFVRHFCRKLLGYALARGVLLSDEPLLDEMQNELKSHDYRFSSAIETILRSQQFRYQRGREME